MTRIDARFNYRKATVNNESEVSKNRRRFLLAMEEWNDDRKEAVILGIDWLTDYYAVVRACPYWKARELATDHAAELVMQILEAA